MVCNDDKMVTWLSVLHDHIRQGSADIILPYSLRRALFIAQWLGQQIRALCCKFRSRRLTKLVAAPVQAGHGVRHRHLQGECAVLLVFILNGAGYAVTVTVFFNISMVLGRLVHPALDADNCQNRTFPHAAGQIFRESLSHCVPFSVMV